MSLTNAQFALRARGITSTDITRIVGESPWGGPCDVFADKLLPIERKPPTVYQRIGDHLEPLVIDLLSEQFGVKLVRNRETMVHANGWAMSTPDATGGGAVGEAKVKSVSFIRPDEWASETSPPGFVTVQSTWHMVVSGTSRCYVGALLDGKPKFYVVDLDPFLAEILMEEGERFYREHLLARVAPPPDGSPGARRMLQAVYPKTNGVVVPANRYAEDLAREYFEARSVRDRAIERAELAAQRLMKYAGPAEGVKGDGWRAKFEWRDPAKVEAHEKVGYRAVDIRATKEK